MTARKTILTSAAAVLLSLGGAVPVRAVDVTPAPKGQVIVLGPGGCATCETAAPAAGCASCGQGHGHGHRAPCTSFFGRHQAPFEVNLCPGSCFGYFQTQWRKWEDVCPYPYLGVGLTDAPRPAGPYIPIPPSSDKLPKGGGLPEPRVVDPKKMMDPTVPPPPPRPAMPIPGSRIN